MMTQCPVIWYLLIGLILWIPSLHFMLQLFFFNRYHCEINETHKHKLTKCVCQCQSIFPELSVFLGCFSQPYLHDAALSLAKNVPLLSELWQAEWLDIIMSGLVNIKMLASIIIKYHFLLSFTHFVVLIASHALMQTFRHRNKGQARSVEPVLVLVLWIVYHFQLETVLVDFWLHLGPRE